MYFILNIYTKLFNNYFHFFSRTFSILHAEKQTMNAQITPQTKFSLNSDGSHKFYEYDPSLPAAVVALISFATVSFYHAWLIKHHRSWYFIPFTIGGFCK